MEYRNVTDGRTDRIAISISRVNVLTRDKKTKTNGCFPSSHVTYFKYVRQKLRYMGL